MTESSMNLRPGLFLWLAWLSNVAGCGAIPAEQMATGRAALVRVQSAGLQGSGVCVDPSGVVLTAAHCLPADARSAAITFDGSATAITGTVLRRDAAQDLAVLQLPRDRSWASVAIATRPPAPGAAVWSLGYPAGQFVASESTVREFVAVPTSGPVLGLFQPRNVPSSVSMLATSQRILPGNSGGPLLDDCGALVGIASKSTFDGAQEPFALYVPTDVIVGAVAQHVRPVAQPRRGARVDDTPVLLVFIRAGCVPCKRFDTDYARGRSGMGRALSALVDVQFVDTDTPAGKQRAIELKVTAFPSFVLLAGDGTPRSCGTGYATGDGPKLLSVVTETLAKATAEDRRYQRDEPSRPAPDADPETEAWPNPIPLPTAPDPGDAPQGDRLVAPPPAPTPVELPAEREFESRDPKSLTVIVTIGRTSLPDALVRLAENLSGSIRRAIRDELGPVSVELVLERTSPTRFAAIREAAGIGEPLIGVVAVVGRQDVGWIKGLIVGRIQAAAKPILEQIGSANRNIAIDVIFERSDAATVASLRDAIALDETGLDASGNGSDGGSVELSEEWQAWYARQPWYIQFLAGTIASALGFSFHAEVNRQRGKP